MQVRTPFAVVCPAADVPRGRIHPPLLRLLEYWESKGGGKPPRWRSFDPAEVKECLRQLVVWDVTAEGYRCRLAGTLVCEAAERELKGAAPTDMSWDTEGEVRAEFDAVRDGEGLAYVERRPVAMAVGYVGFSRLLTPWTDEDGRISFLVGCMEFAVRGTLSA